MQVTMATSPAKADQPNEDWAGATTSAAVVLDGLSEASETGCVHGTPWYVHQLGSKLLWLAGDSGRGLEEVLAESIDAVAAMHRDSCDLAHPGSPCTTVTMVRHAGESLEYLVLSDSIIVLDRVSGGPLVVQDKSVDAFASDSARAAISSKDKSDKEALFTLIREQQQVRNRPGGYWVAQVDPSAAAHAMSGFVVEVRGAALLSDGAALLVTDFSAMDWPRLLTFTYEHGPSALIAATREFEDRDPNGVIWPRYKHRDDATAVVCRL
ncbi:hypothetical protein ACN267_28450 [Micromonospora sp. WMMD734]|uniref:Protein phosphatase 2C n=1 Tax=Micromonospora humidisoli TaxID=2807622 RepID=A0ABS2J777_9ACTN|nr:hypothetical protein [Micromonospora humidisoli]MBM7082387.1 hypothetical protein [Micromonospora humidisoli]